MHRVLPYPVIRCQNRHTVCHGYRHLKLTCLYYHREPTCSSIWCTHTCIYTQWQQRDMGSFLSPVHHCAPIMGCCARFHYPHKECVLIQTVARAHSFFMTLPLPSVTQVTDSVQDMDHNAIHDEYLYRT